MANVKLQNVYKYYPGNEVPAVVDFNLEVKDKEFVVFVGPSGCGKSTTLRMIAGLEDISQGTIEIDDVVVNDMEPKDRDIAMVFQNYALYPHMTVYQNIAFALKHKRIIDIKKDKEGNPILDKEGKEIQYKRKYTKAEINEKVMEAAETLEITEYLKRKPKALSGGQRQRVAIGRAIVRKPKAFLMDEPLSNLDAKLRNQMRAEIILLRKRINSTFIYVTHDQVEAMTLGDRIVVMKDGVIQQVGTPNEVFEMPSNLFVAGFIGSPKMNFIDCELEENKGVYSINILGEKLKISAELNQKLLNKGIKAQSIVLGIRPEHIQLNENGSLKANVNITEMMGSQLLVHAVGKNGKDLVISVPNIGIKGELKDTLYNNGEIKFNLQEESIHLFDIENGENLLK
ncbi:MAG: ATP-binding cassette domain-containing protein [Bacilli bacterium]|nr:ATP-binding cassette domain-containing protein [Bacilli bacterium]MBR1582120.1 ATP-binding cassette domain-containing protein [Bacilli bacterium]